MSNSTPHPTSSRSKATTTPSASGGFVRDRSIFSATRSTLSDQGASEADDRKETLLQRLPSAAQALRYEAVLDAFSHMGKDVIVEEFRDYASARNPIAFACVRPVDGDHLEVGIALEASEDDSLTACAGQWVSKSIKSKFRLGNNEPISGKQLRLIRLSSRAVAEKKA